MTEFVCISPHCSNCRHYCVRLPSFIKKLEEGKIDIIGLILDPMVHQFEPKNNDFIEIEGFIPLSEDEILQLAELGDKAYS